MEQLHSERAMSSLIKPSENPICVNPMIIETETIMGGLIPERTFLFVSQENSLRSKKPEGDQVHYRE
jgi:hypothetical protein